MDSSDSLSTICRQLSITPDDLGVMVIDHGSRREESNAALLEVVEMFRQNSPYRLIEPAHMELAEPTIMQALDLLVAGGAKFVAAHPYFLLPGRHWNQDIPKLVDEAASRHPNVRYLVTSPLGVHAAMAQIMNDRIMHCLAHRSDNGPACDLCQEVDRCGGERAE